MTEIELNGRVYQIYRPLSTDGISRDITVGYGGWLLRRYFIVKNKTKTISYDAEFAWLTDADEIINGVLAGRILTEV